MRKMKQGFYRLKNIAKYKGDPRNVVYRRSWEFKLFCFLDDNKNVIEWSSEEIVIPYISPRDNRVHRYFPDVFCKVKSKDGFIKTILIEVKPYTQTIPPEKKTKVTKRYLNEVLVWAVNQAKFAAAKDYCEQKGWQFQLMTEKELGIS